MRGVPWGHGEPWERAALVAHLRAAYPVVAGGKEAKHVPSKSSRAGF